MFYACSQLYIIWRFIYEEADVPHPPFCILFFLSSNRASRCVHSSTHRFMSLLFAKAEYAPRRLYHPSSPVLVGRHLGCLFEAYVQEKFWGQVTPTHTLADSYQSVFLKPSTELVFSNLNFLIFCQSGNWKKSPCLSLHC